MTDKQAAFVREYLVDHCATQAAVRAGYSSDTAQEQGSRLLSNVMVRREIDRLVAERSERLGIDAEEVVRRFDCLYYEALVVGDLATATRCTEALAKCVGAFGKHNQQKRPMTREEAEQYELELQMRGLDLTRVNAPEHLKVPPILREARERVKPPSEPTNGFVSTNGAADHT